MFRWMAVFLPLALSVFAFAATLTPERRVAPIGGITRAAWDQGLSTIASNGGGFVAVWSDLRSSHRGTSATLREALLYASHIELDGTFNPAAGVEIGSGFNEAIAS